MQFIRQSFELSSLARHLLKSIDSRTNLGKYCLSVCAFHPIVKHQNYELLHHHQNIYNAIDTKSAGEADDAMQLHLNGTPNDLPKIEAVNLDLFE